MEGFGGRWVFVGLEAGNKWSVAWAWLGKGGARESLDWMGGKYAEAADWCRAGPVGVAGVENCFRF